jgi:hypothetical protein
MSVETGEIKYTSEGSLLGHIVMSVTHVDEVAKELGVNDSEEVMLLKHCILSHHGKREWGSPIEPAIPEALIIHYCDGLDAELFKMQHSINGIKPGTSVYEKGKVYYKRGVSWDSVKDVLNGSTSSEAYNGVSSDTSGDVLVNKSSESSNELREDKNNLGNTDSVGDDVGDLGVTFVSSGSVHEEIDYAEDENYGSYKEALIDNRQPEEILVRLD